MNKKHTYREARIGNEDTNDTCKETHLTGSLQSRRQQPKQKRSLTDIP
jgi:hypothetical protein